MFGIKQKQDQNQQAGQTPAQAMAQKSPTVVHTMVSDAAGTAVTVGVATATVAAPATANPFDASTAAPAQTAAQTPAPVAPRGDITFAVPDRQQTAAAPAATMPTSATQQAVLKSAGRQPAVSQDAQQPVQQRRGSGTGCVIAAAMILIVLTVAGFFLRDTIMAYVGPLLGMTSDKPAATNQSGQPVTTQPSQPTSASNLVTDSGAVTVGAVTMHGRAITVSTDTQVGDFVAALRSASTVTDGMPVEIIVREGDADMVFDVFARRFLPQMPAEMLSALSQPFRLYVSPEADGTARTTLYTTSSDPDATRGAIRAAENSLLSAMMPLIAFRMSVPSAMTFQDSAHNGVPIRFYNFLPDATQSIDYATQYEHVFVGTSRATMRAVMDAVFAQSVADAALPIAEGSNDMMVAPGTGPAADVTAPVAAGAAPATPSPFASPSTSTAPAAAPTAAPGTTPPAM